MTKKILFLHGFFASGSCIPAQALRQAFTGKAEVLTPDLPLHPKEALTFIEEICKQEKPCVLVGNSNGAFLAQIVASRLEIPALLGNPYLEMTRFLIERIGEHEYKSPRADGQQQLVIDQSLIDKFAEVQAHRTYTNGGRSAGVLCAVSRKTHTIRSLPTPLRREEVTFHFNLLWNPE